MPKTEAEVEAEIGRLADLDFSALKERWRALYGSEPPARLSRELILRAIAYRIQEEAFGGLSRSLKVKLSSMTKPGRVHPRMKNKSPTSAPGAGDTTFASADIGADSTPPSHIRIPRIRRDRKVKHGTKFIREWNGRLIEVIAMADGRYLYGGEVYRSLSAVARTVTGTRWSGPAFFGIATKPGGYSG